MLYVTNVFTILREVIYLHCISLTNTVLVVVFKSFIDRNKSQHQHFFRSVCLWDKLIVIRLL